MALIKKSDIGKLTNTYEIDNLKKENKRLDEKIKEYEKIIANQEDQRKQNSAKKKKKIKNLDDLGFYLMLAICGIPWIIALIYVSVR